MPYIKVHQGTSRADQPSLCRSCTYAFVMQDAGGEHIKCQYNRPFSPKGLVTSCNSYEDKSLPSRRDYEEVAWTLNIDKGGRVIGFAPPEKKKHNNYD